MKTSDRELSIFVDESGSFDSPLDPSRFNVITCVFHDQSTDLSSQIADLETQLCLLGYPGVCIHAGPLVRREAEFLSLPLEDRRKLLGKILSFALHVPVHYHAFCIDKRYATTPEVISKALTAQLTDYLASSQEWLSEYAHLKVYYDNGQMRVSAILNNAFKTLPTVFVPCVKPERYRLFQVADLMEGFVACSALTLSHIACWYLSTGAGAQPSSQAFLQVVSTAGVTPNGLRYGAKRLRTSTGRRQSTNLSRSSADVMPPMRESG